MRRTLWILCLILLISCSDDDPVDTAQPDAGHTDTAVEDDADSSDTGDDVRGATLRFSPESDDFFDLPMPSDARLKEDGTYGFADWPDLNSNRLGELWLEGADDLKTGWGLTSAIYAWFSDPIDPSTLPASYTSSLEDDSPVMLVNVDPDSADRGARLPIECKYTEAEGTYHAANQVACASPYGVLRDRSTRYALVFTTDFKDATGSEIAPSDELVTLMSGEDVGSTAAAPYAETAEFLDSAGIDVASMVLFTTTDPTERFLRVTEYYQGLEDPVLDESKPASVIADYDSYVVVEAFYDLPLLQEGAPPYPRPPEGRLVFDESGDLVRQGTESLKVLITLPKMEMPEGGFPTLFYLHGSGGTATQLMNRGARAVPSDVPAPGSGPAAAIAPYGIAGFAADFAMHDSRMPQNPDLTGLQLYNLLENPRAMIDNFAVASNEVAMHARLLANVTFDPSLHEDLDPGDAADGLIRFNSDRFAAMGQSMGSMIGTPTMTIESPLDAFINAGSGGTLIEIAISSRDPIDLKPALERAFRLRDDEELDRYDIVLNGVQHLFDFMDPYVHARHMIAEPHPGVTPRHLFHPSGLEDRYFSPASRAGLSTAFEAPLVEPVLEPVAFELMKWVGYTDPVTPPVSGNLSDGQVTGFVRQYEPAYPEGGHYVIFDKPEARAQYACFIKSLGNGPPTLYTVENSSVENCP